MSDEAIADALHVVLRRSHGDRLACIVEAEEMSAVICAEITDDGVTALGCFRANGIDALIQRLLQVGMRPRAELLVVRDGQPVQRIEALDLWQIGDTNVGRRHFWENEERGNCARPHICQAS
jgi:hypothetical protein